MANQALYSGFIDLVGIRNRASQDVSEYWEALSKFQEHVRDYCFLLRGKEGQVYFFSDCAFVQASKASELIDFFSRLRSQLLQDGLYFKASIARGGLDAKNAADAPAGFTDELRTSLNETLFGHFFGKKAADLFGLQEELKGIGVRIDRSNLPKAILARNCVRSCFMKSGRTVEEYTDLRLSEDDLREDVLDGILRAFFKSKSQTKKVGRFYISLLVTWVQSVNLRRYSATSGEGLVGVLLGGGFLRLFSDIAGVEHIYFALLNRVYLERDLVPRKLYYDVRRYVLGQKAIFKHIDRAPKTILDPIVRNEVLEDVSGDLLKGPAEERKATERIQELVAEGLKPGDVARKLEQEGFPPTSRLPRWHANTVRALCLRKNIQLP